MLSNLSSSHHNDHEGTPAGMPVSIQPCRARNELELDEEQGELEHRIMAIDKSPKATIGCASYVAGNGKLLCMDDIENAEEGVFESC